MKALPRTILIVDDDATLRQALVSVLDSLGYHVLAAGNPDTAYELVAAETPDAVLLDVRLPSMSGLALYLAIVNRWPTLEGRIALMTGDPDAADVRPWLAARHCHVFRKPFRFDGVTTWLDATLKAQPHRAAGT